MLTPRNSPTHGTAPKTRFMRPDAHFRALLQSFMPRSSRRLLCVSLVYLSARSPRTPRLHRPAAVPVFRSSLAAPPPKYILSTQFITPRSSPMFILPSSSVSRSRLSIRKHRRSSLSVPPPLSLRAVPTTTSLTSRHQHFGRAASPSYHFTIRKPASALGSYMRSLRYAAERRHRPPPPILLSRLVSFAWDSRARIPVLAPHIGDFQSRRCRHRYPHAFRVPPREKHSLLCADPPVSSVLRPVGISPPALCTSFFNVQRVLDLPALRRSLSTVFLLRRRRSPRPTRGCSMQVQCRHVLNALSTPLRDLASAIVGSNFYHPSTRTCSVRFLLLLGSLVPRRRITSHTASLVPRLNRLSANNKYKTSIRHDNQEIFAGTFSKLAYVVNATH